MPRFYFTYSATPSHPYQGGWTEIEAPDRPSACAIFEMFHPSLKSDMGLLSLLNCADIYSEEEFLASKLKDGNYGARCHERIILSREILDAGGLDHD